MSDVGYIALISAVALLGPLLAYATGGVVPAVIGQLLAGVVIGDTGLRIVDPTGSGLTLLYTLGFATLMFTVGMNVPLHDQRVLGALRGGCTAVVLSVPLALLAGYGARAISGGPALVYAVVIVSSSAAVALPIIDENKLTGSAVLTSIAWITIADIVATIAVPLAITPAKAGNAALGALIVAALVAVVFLVGRRLGGVPLVHRIRKAGKHRGWAIDLRVAVTVLFGLSFVAGKVGASVLVAGFGAGLVVGAIGGPKRLSREVLGLGQGFFVPLFFVLLGTRLNLRSLGSGDAVLLAAVLAAAAIAVHVAVAALIHAPAAVGLLASAQIGVPAAAIALGLERGALDQGQASAIFCAALLSVGASALGAARLRRGQAAVAPPPTAAAAPVKV